MPASPLSSAQEARKAIADRLGSIRRDAELTGLELAQRCGWHASKSSRIENARTVPSDADIRAWCESCGAPEQAADLIAASRSAGSMYTEWKRIHRTGMRRTQEAIVPLYERTRHMRVYCSAVVPGLLQTPAYATAGQLSHLLTVLSLPNVSLGVLPFKGRRKLWPVESFSIFDETRVQVELLSARVIITAPGEISTYAKAFQDMSRMAVYGAKARALITGAMDALG
ncbi:Scr1 family TA system antitoxin-like transcriptional regulator [Kitasatospora purpeofusca]|uniref:Scr1 family TA system antitoxin-like transcriptional regulator n=1 Tax=Kitasatospora purpeofusca TaxID=67352 RepID=UPI0038698819|nr:helix-turn-helix domain-containing protein [Kitasatospora purpeofusca]